MPPSARTKSSGLNCLREVRGALGRHPARHLTIRQAGRHLHGRAEDAPALLLRGGDDAGDLIGREREVVLTQNVDGGLVGRARQPRVDVGDRPMIERGGEQEAGQEVLAGRVEVGIGLGARIAAARREVLGQARGLHLVGDVGERVPPPGRFFERDRLQVEVSIRVIVFLVNSTSAKPTQRLQELEKSNDGFYLAEVDLKLRGPGEIYGRAQHGALNLQIATLADAKLIARTKNKLNCSLQVTKTCYNINN